MTGTMFPPFKHLSTRRMYSQLTTTIGRHSQMRNYAYKKYLPYPMLPEVSPKLSKIPCKLAYIKSCKCWQLQPYVQLVPDDLEGGLINGSLDEMTGLLMDQELDICDVSISSNSLFHPTAAGRSTSCRVAHSADGHNPSTAWTLASCKRKHQIHRYIDVTFEHADFPSAYTKPEQQHIWIVPAGWQVPRAG